MRNGLNILDVLGIDVSSLDPSMLQNFIRKDELEKLGDQLGQRFKISNGTDIIESYSKQLMPNLDKLLAQADNLGKFKLRAFDSQEELDSYIADERVGTDPDFEGVCFAFAVHENEAKNKYELELFYNCLLYTSPSPRDMRRSRMPSSA